LDGAHNYRLHFSKEGTPPVNAFWPVTLYDAEGFPVPNSLNRHALSSWMAFEPEADGSLNLYIQYESPEPGKEANWLPAPKGPFNVLFRMYAPKFEALTGQWNQNSVAARWAHIG